MPHEQSCFDYSAAVYIISEDLQGERERELYFVNQGSIKYTEHEIMVFVSGIDRVDHGLLHSRPSRSVTMQKISGPKCQFSLTVTSPTIGFFSCTVVVLYLILPSLQFVLVSLYAGTSCHTFFRLARR